MGVCGSWLEYGENADIISHNFYCIWFSMNIQSTQRFFFLIKTQLPVIFEDFLLRSFLSQCFGRVPSRTIGIMPQSLLPTRDL